MNYQEPKRNHHTHQDYTCARGPSVGPFARVDLNEASVKPRPRLGKPRPRFASETKAGVGDFRGNLGDPFYRGCLGKRGHRGGSPGPEGSKKVRHFAVASKLKELEQKLRKLGFFTFLGHVPS